MSDSEKDTTTRLPDSDGTPAAGDSGLAALQRERDELYDRLLRTTAEFDNYRKRTDRERRDLREMSAADVVHELLPVVDDLERALEAARPPDAEPGAADAVPLGSFRRGVELIHRQLLEFLRRRGVEPFEALGEPFDPNWHEAVGHDPADGRADGEVTVEVRRGYRIGPRLLRAAMVRVAKA
jgi:molecular chaperone GrpE